MLRPHRINSNTSKHRQTRSRVDRHPRKCSHQIERPLDNRNFALQSRSSSLYFIGRNEMEGSKETPGEGRGRLPGRAGRARPDSARRADAGVVTAARGDRRLAGAAVAHHRRSGDGLWDLHGDVCPVSDEGAACLADRREHGQGSPAVLPDVARHVAVSLCLQCPGRVAADAGARSCACWWRRWG